MLGIIILVVVLVVGGIGAYVALPKTSGGAGTSPSGTTHNTPPPACTGNGCAPPLAQPIRHDVTVTSTFATAQAGTPVTFGALLTSAAASTYTFHFGDGNSITTHSSSVSYTYASPGSNLVYVLVKDTSGNLHDNANTGAGANLLPFNVSFSYNSYNGDPVGDHVQTAGTVVSSSSNNSVALSAYIAGPPTNTLTVIGWTAYNVSGPSANALSLGTTGGDGMSAQTPLTVTATAKAGATPGLYNVNFSAGTYVPGTSNTGISVFSFGVFVNAAGATSTIGVGSGCTSNCAPIHQTPHPASPHPRSLVVYEETASGASTLDPSVDYESVGAEVIANVYETLIEYNGSHATPDPSSFVPEAATCVPGSTTGPYSCMTMYGSSLIGPTAGDYTFVINPNAKFYNPYTASSYAVSPSDVVWSVARTCLFADYPSAYVNNGWVLCQSLLPYGSSKFDAGMHAPWASTPANILSSMTVNGPECPLVGGSPAGAGCVTFHTALGGVPGVSAFPFFLELVEDPLGAAIQSCSWEQSQGFTLPGWTSCSTIPSASSYPLGTEWDAAEMQGAQNNWNQNIATQMVGSGPYYLQAYSPGGDYAVKLSPAWTGTTCLGGHANGCVPNANQIEATQASITWEKTATPGESAYSQGTADFATIPNTDTSTMLNLIAQGKIGAFTSPTMIIFFSWFNFATDETAAQSLTTTTLTAPSYMMQDLNMRQFLVHAFPYQTQQSTQCVVQGVPYCELYGGAIPRGEGSFYPGNISWPSGNPSTSTGSPNDAGYWWSAVQADNLDGPKCTTAKPCVYAQILPQGDPGDLAMYNAWAGWINTISSGAVNMVVIPVTFSNEITFLGQAPGTAPYQGAFLGWIPDYPDPSDNTAPMLYPDASYTYSSGFCEGMTDGTNCALPSVAQQNYMGACTGGTLSSPTQVSTACQGTEYNEMVALAQAGDACIAPCPVSQRILDYSMAENIQNQLGLYVYDFQQVGTSTYAPWINPAAFTPNPVELSLWFGTAYYNQPLP
ncbi:MAG: PKD domain-containing protein [Euryarchaeota archaeon]|nr:PKD domain-containing protein [Euryarchaeota archaeon]MDE1836095.1 PKD domain-containing protein [Euryarchaeota archaeon]MDE1879385.1 PKD domain-containing protein [Euryarchaeota archaeon]MDE2044073.1 PKD domain-containing protein [Thermoplasmata archaeon]